jgi:threonylcarbamoyladenosine tRNA methylthiotransferase MtaB
MYKKTFSSYSFGCRVNEAEKQHIDAGMIREGFIQDSLNPDIFIINTCAVTAKAERETRQLIFKLKRKTPASRSSQPDAALPTGKKIIFGKIYL